MRALIIDDSRTMLMILSKILQDLGFDVDGAVDGRAALELMAREPAPELVLVDWNMPVMTGVEFIEAARKAPYLSNARIVMVTGEAESPRVIAALSAGADEYIMKPFTKAVILEKLELLGFDI